MRRYERKSVEVGVFRSGWVNLNAEFTGKWVSPTNQCWCPKTRVIAVSCGIKISTVRHLILSQYTRLTDRRTDRQADGRTDGRTDRQNCDSKTVRYITCSRTVKRGQKFKSRSRDPVSVPNLPNFANFWIGLAVVNLRTKFEVCIFSRSVDTEGPKI